MSPAEWEKVNKLFQAARAKSRSEQTALLDSAHIDSDLREVIEQMLREDEAASSFLSKPLLASFFAAGSLNSETVFHAGLVPATKFGRYEIVAPLGRGGMGEVWRAHDRELDRPVALKFLTQQVGSEGAMERLTREARAASALNHPSIVTIYEVIRHEENSILVMELVEGTTLRAMCGSPQPLERVVRIGTQVAEALAAAHAHAIVHRDIKPENIIVRNDGYVKVLDFGLARRIGGADTGASPFFSGGTLRYLSPEQARGEPLTPANDVFSLGLVLYELATGQQAFLNESPFGAVCTMLSTEAAAPSAVNPNAPAELDALILAMLAKNVPSRPSAQDVAHRLNQAAMRTKGRSNRIWAAWKWTIAAVVIVVAAGVLWLRARQPGGPQFANLQIEPATSQDGWEADPVFSPDGKSIAFSWTPNLQTRPQLYIKRDSANAPVQLTDPKAKGVLALPAWSPDGKWIAFKRDFESSSGIFVVPSVGGEQKKLLDLRVVNLAHSMDWSPDGKQLAFSDLSQNSTRLAIYLLDLQTKHTRQLTSPAPIEVGDWDPKFSPDGRTIAFKRIRSYWDDAIYTVPAVGGEARRATWQGGGIWGHSWMPDGKSLVLSCQLGSSSFGLWRFPLDRRSAPERIIQGAADSISPAVSWATGRLAWVNQDQDVNIYRVPVNGAQPSSMLIGSVARDQDAAYAPDGRIAFLSDRSGTREIWLTRADDSDQHRVTNFRGSDINNLAWSPDNRHLAFYRRSEGRSDIFTVDCDPAHKDCGDPQMRVSEMKAERPAWSKDGSSLYFSSDRTGGWQIWRQPLAGGEPVQVTHHGGFGVTESPDGKWLYISKSDGSVWRIHLPLNTSGASAEEKVIGSPFFVQWTGWTVTPREIIFTDGARPGEPGCIRAYNSSTGRTRVVSPFLRGFPDSRNFSVSVSQDFKWILYSQLDRSTSNIMFGENR